MPPNCKGFGISGAGFYDETKILLNLKPILIPGRNKPGRF
jgi:hypothetical protein